MTEAHTGELLLHLGGLFGLSFLLGGLLERWRIPGILAALLVAMASHGTRLGEALTRPPFEAPFAFLAQIGVLFLLFFIGMQIDRRELRSLRGDIVWATVLNTALPFLFGVAVMLVLGYGWTVAFVVGLSRMPTAEAVIVPILDEFQMVRTRVGEFIVGVGVLDDVIEVFLVAFVSVWIGEKTLGASGTKSEIAGIAIGLATFALAAWVAGRWLLPSLSKWLPRRPRNLVLLSMLVLFGFGGLSAYAHLGVVVGAIVAGTLMRPVFNGAGETGEQTVASVRAVSYGLFGIVFFFWVGLGVDLRGMVDRPALAILLFLSAFVGKILGIFSMVPMKKLTSREAWLIGVGLNARLTTEIIVAKLLLDADLIDVHLFTALVAASSLSTVVVPLAFAFMLARFGSEPGKPIDSVAR